MATRQLYVGTNILQLLYRSYLLVQFNLSTKMSYYLVRLALFGTACFGMYPQVLRISIAHCPITFNRHANCPQLDKRHNVDIHSIFE